MNNDGIGMDHQNVSSCDVDRFLCPQISLFFTINLIWSRLVLSSCINVHRIPPLIV